MARTGLPAWSAVQGPIREWVGHRADYPGDRGDHGLDDLLNSANIRSPADIPDLLTLANLQARLLWRASSAGPASRANASRNRRPPHGISHDVAVGAIGPYEQTAGPTCLEAARENLYPASLRTFINDELGGAAGVDNLDGDIGGAVRVLDPIHENVVFALGWQIGHEPNRLLPFALVAVMQVAVANKWALGGGMLPVA